MLMPYKIYELLARQIIDNYGIINGRCLDMSTDQGLMGLEIAKRSNLLVFISSPSGHTLASAESRCSQEGLAERVAVVRSSAEDLPFIDSYFDLILSQGSIFYWPDLAAVFKEIFRVLKPEGKAYIGEGPGRDRLSRDQQFSFQTEPIWPGQNSPDPDKIRSPEYMQEVLRQAAIHNYNLVIGSESWIEIWK